MTELLRLTVSIMLISPLMGAFIISLMSKRIGGKGSEAVGIVMSSISLLMALLLWYQIVSLEMPKGYSLIYRWVDTESWHVVMGVWVDRLSVCMAFMVSSISWLVQIYSVGYMRDDPGYARYFSLINVFTGAMLVLVMSSNMMEMFFAWEAMSVASYGLIGFWYERESASLAAFKAIMVNRLGDYGLLMGILLWGVWSGSWNVSDMLVWNASHVSMTMNQLYCVTGLMLLGIMSKSAQIPLHIWLPDSMEGPTPISALIHAATMVTAGVFWIIRFSTLFSQVPLVSCFLMIIGSVGALWMGMIACTRDDIKSVIAYSTLSQLGIMIAGCGIMAYNLVLFHVFTHACTKAMLFLAAGQVIYYMQHEQDMRQMGGLMNRLPITMVVMFLGSLSLVGIPPFSGFWSKDSIIHVMLHQADYVPVACAWLIILSGGFSAAYMTRLIKNVFFGSLRTEPLQSERMNGMLLVVLSFLLPSIFLGVWILPAMMDAGYWGFMDVPMRQISLIKEEGGFLLIKNIWTQPSVYVVFLGSFMAWNIDYIHDYMPSVCTRTYAACIRLGLMLDDWFWGACRIIWSLGEVVNMIDDVGFQTYCVTALGMGVYNCSVWIKSCMNGQVIRLVQSLGVMLVLSSLLITYQIMGVTV